MLLLKRDAPKAVQNSQFSKASEKFSARQRLLREDGFDNVLHAGNMANRFYKVFFAQNSRDMARLGIISSKKNLPSAVARNRAKRSIREAFRHHKISRCKLDLVVMIRPAYVTETHIQENSLVLLLNKVASRCVEL